MSSFFAQATHFSILILLVLAILDCTCRAASHFRFDEATGFIFAVRDGLQSGDPLVYRVASVSTSIDFRSEFWQLYDALAQAIHSGAVTARSNAPLPATWLSPEDQPLFYAGIRGDPSADTLADAIESSWNSGEFKRVATLYRSAQKMSLAEFQNSYRLVALLTRYLSNAKLFREGLLAADILVAVYPNLFQAHMARARALTMLSLWDAALQEIDVVRRLQPSLKFLAAYEKEVRASAAKDAAASEGARSPYSDSADSSRGATAGMDDGLHLDSWSSVLRGFAHPDLLPYVIFDAVVCSCFVVLYTYFCRINAAAAAKTNKSAAAAAAAAAHVLPAAPAAALRRSRP